MHQLQLCHTPSSVSDLYDRVIGQSLLQPRDYQRRINIKTHKMFTGRYRNGAGDLLEAAKSVQITSPTGSGKTPMGLVNAKMLQEETGCHVVWISMRRNLLNQAGRENAAPCGTNPTGKDIGVDIRFLSMFTREMPEDLLPENRTRPLLFVHDECQHDAADSATHMHNEFRPEWVLGLSATPYRTDRVKLPFQMVVEDAGIHELIQGGWLSPYDHYTIQNWEPEVIAEMYAMDPLRWGQSLMFFNTYEQCQRCNDRLGQLGFRFDIVTGNTDREAQIEALTEGRVQGLINMMVLTEGFNYPDLKTVWVRDSGKGTTIQMAGRVFRLSDQHSRKQVVQSKETHWTMLKTATPKQQWVWQESEWLTLETNPRIDEIADASRMASVNVETNIPVSMRDGNRKKRAKKWSPAAK